MAIGTRALARTLLLQCVILLIRRRLQADDQSLAWMRGLGDGALWGALRSMLDQPARSHTVDSLADHVGMSRAAFASRFRDSFRMGPIELLRTIRLRRAAELLSVSRVPIKRIANMVGYDSRTCVTRAFTGEYQLSPEEFRRLAGAAAGS